MKGYDRWIKHKDPRLKQRLLAYNEDDCRATAYCSTPSFFPYMLTSSPRCIKRRVCVLRPLRSPKKTHIIGSDSGSSPASVSTDGLVEARRLGHDELKSDSKTSGYN
ncbi:MAG: ribonuclease H-like domain-containing protein [Gammaproteobacteria bacterium]